MEAQSLARADPASGPTGRPFARRVLACIDDEGAGPAIVQWVQTLPASFDREVVLLGLLPKPEDVRTRGIFLDAVRQHLRETGERRVAAVASALKDADLTQRHRVELVDDAQSIIDLAREEGADVIVLVGKPLGALQRRIVAALPFRSLASRVVELADIPVLVLRQAID